MDESRHLLAEFERVTSLPIGAAQPGSLERLTTIWALTPLREVADVVRFPDWLGYLGIVLGMLRSRPKARRKLTEAWVPQFLELGGSTATWTPFLEATSRPLEWSDLEEAETERIGALKPE